MSDDEYLRADADYELKRSFGSSRWVLTDKRTGHRYIFTDVQPKGYKNNVFLRNLSPFERQKGQHPSTGNRVGMLDKDSLPEWLIEEFEHINTEGCMTPATDPRGNNE